MPDLTPADRKAILQVHRQWVRAERDGRIEDLLDLCAADVSWWVPGRDLSVGKEAARALLTSTAVEIVEIKTRDVQVRGSGTMAYKTSKYRTRYRRMYGGPEQVSEGTHLWVLRNESDGRWRVVLVTWQQT